MFNLRIIYIFTNIKSHTVLLQMLKTVKTLSWREFPSLAETRIIQEEPEQCIERLKLPVIKDTTIKVRKLVVDAKEQNTKKFCDKNNCDIENCFIKLISDNNADELQPLPINFKKNNTTSELQVDSNISFTNKLYYEIFVPNNTRSLSTSSNYQTLDCSFVFESFEERTGVGGNYSFHHTSFQHTTFIHYESKSEDDEEDEDEGDEGDDEILFSTEFFDALDINDNNNSQLVSTFDWFANVNVTMFYELIQ